MIGVTEMKTKNRFNFIELFLYGLGGIAYLALLVMFGLTAFGFLYSYIFRSIGSVVA
jgi:hypothetical protein